MKPSEKERLIAELQQQLHDEGRCPICNKKKHAEYTEERRQKLSESMKAPRKRESPTTTKILVAIKNADAEFTLSGIAQSTKTPKNTVREIVRRMVKLGEILPPVDMSDNRTKSSTFGKAEFWNELEREGNVALKSLPG